MRLSKPLLTRRKGFLIISLLFFSHIGAFGTISQEVVVPLSSFNKTGLLLPMQQQHSIEKVQGNITPTTPTTYTGVEASYKAAPINIHPENIQSAKSGLYPSVPVGTSAIVSQISGGGAFATAKHIAPKKTKTINQTHTALSQVGAAQPVIMRAADSDDDDDWNPGGTGGFDNPGEPPVIPVPLTDGIATLLLMAIAYTIKRKR